MAEVLHKNEIPVLSGSFRLLTIKYLNLSVRFKYCTKTLQYFFLCIGLRLRSKCESEEHSSLIYGLQRFIRGKRFSKWDLLLVDGLTKCSVSLNFGSIKIVQFLQFCLSSTYTLGVDAHDVSNKGVVFRMQKSVFSPILLIKAKFLTHFFDVFSKDVYKGRNVLEDRFSPYTTSHEMDWLRSTLAIRTSLVTVKWGENGNQSGSTSRVVEPIKFHEMGAQADQIP
ncbi:hypothetical protein ACFE04_008349 [Oxalis oulophora]